MNELVIGVYDVVAFAGALLLMYVIRQAMNDLHLNRTDPQWVLKARKATFFFDAALLLLTVYFQDYWLVHPSLITTGIVTTMLVGGGISILAVNVVSLHKRAPPSRERGHYVRPARAHWWRRTIS